MSEPRSIAHPYHPLFAAMYDRFMDMNVALLAPLRAFAAGGATGRVLEVGAGTGQNLSHYDWPRVVSLDLTEPDRSMLRRAQERVAASGSAVAAKVTTHDALAEALPFADACFDTVVATLVLCTVTDLDAAIAEIRRVVRTGGSLRLVEHVQASALAGVVQRVIQPVYGGVSGGCHLNRRTEDVLRAQGFTLDVVQRTTLGIPIFPTLVGIATKVVTAT